VILITAHVEAASKERALASGADELVSVPVDRQELLARARSLMRLGAFRADLEQGESVVLSLSGLLEAKDPATNGHSARVAELAARLAREMGLGEEAEATLKTAGLLHDIGKVAIPERVLHQQVLSSKDLELLASHPVRGCELLEDLACAREALPAIRHHHEQSDGSGYPDGLAGDAIPLGARVLGVANAFDALTVRGRMSPEEAARHLSREAREGKWDADVAGALEALYREGRLAPPVGDGG
jgi:putative two-component system response regulator